MEIEARTSDFTTQLQLTSALEQGKLWLGKQMQDAETESNREKRYNPNFLQEPLILKVLPCTWAGAGDGGRAGRGAALTAAGGRGRRDAAGAGKLAARQSHLHSWNMCSSDILIQLTELPTR